MRRRAAAEELDACSAWRRGLLAERKPGSARAGSRVSGAGGLFWNVGSRAESGASACAGRPPLPRRPPSPGCLRFPRKTRRPGNRWGRSDRSPPASRPSAPHCDRPTHLKGPWLPGLPPSRRLPPHLRAALFITSAPIPGPWAGAGCCAALIVAGISAPPRAGGDKFSFRKLGGTFSKTPRPRAGKSEPLCSQPSFGRPPGGAGPLAPGTRLGLWGVSLELGKVELRAKYGRVPRAGGHRGQRMAGRVGRPPQTLK